MSRPLPVWTRIACKGCDRCVVLTDVWMSHIGRDYFGNPSMRELPPSHYFRLRCTRCGATGRFSWWPPEEDKSKDRRKLYKAVYELTNCRRCGGWGCAKRRRLLLGIRMGALHDFRNERSSLLLTCDLH